MKKYFNDAIIGNKEILASYTKKGELIRLFASSNDYRQFIDFYHVGLKINDSDIIYLHDDINNTYNQHYVEDTNILITEITNSYFKLQVTQTDFIDTKENNNILKKTYYIRGEYHERLYKRYIRHSKNDK